MEAYNFSGPAGASPDSPFRPERLWIYVEGVRVHEVGYMLGLAYSSVSGAGLLGLQLDKIIICSKFWPRINDRKNE